MNFVAIVLEAGERFLDKLHFDKATECEVLAKELKRWAEESPADDRRRECVVKLLELDSLSRKIATKV